MHRVRHAFDDLDALREQLLGWDVEFHPLAPRQFQADLFQLLTPDVLISRVRLGPHIEHLGAAPPGYRTFALVGMEGVRWCGSVVGRGQLISFPAGGDFEANSGQGGFIHTVSLRSGALAEAAQALGLPGPDDGPAGHGPAVIQPLPDVLSELRGRVERLCAEADCPGFSAEEELIAQLAGPTLRAFSGAGAVPPETERRRSARAVDRAVALMHERLREPPTLRDLCEATQVSERALRGAFVARFGVPPKAYMKAQRLRAVRLDLRAANPSDTRVADVANAWGFWHMGDFAADYRDLMGELPSDTLRKRARMGRALPV